jgi:F0F1-type ATP synthase epsilon subunit
VTLLAGIAELSEEIDVPRAERARDEAAQRVAELRSGRGGASEGDDTPDPALRQAEEALDRAELRLSVAGSGE